MSVNPLSPLEFSVCRAMLNLLIILAIVLNPCLSCLLANVVAIMYVCIMLVLAIVCKC